MVFGLLLRGSLCINISVIVPLYENLKRTSLSSVILYMQVVRSGCVCRFSPFLVVEKCIAAPEAWFKRVALSPLINYGCVLGADQGSGPVFFFL